MQVDDAVLYLTENGGALVHSSVSDPAESQIIFAMPQQSLSAVADLDGAHLGIMFDQDDDSVLPVSLECVAGLCSADLLADVVGGEVLATFELNLTGTLDFPEVGFITG